MTNGIRANDFSDMASPFTGFPTTPYPSPPFHNPNFYYSYPYTTPPPTPPLQYTPPPTPPHFFHFVEPPPLQFYTTTYTPFVPLTPLISDVTKGFLHQLNTKVTQLDEKLAEISMLIEEKKGVTYLPYLVQVNVSEGSPEVCEDSTQNQNSTEVIVDEQCEDKRNQIIQILEKMEKRLADLSNPVKEMPSNKVNRSFKTPTPVLIDDSLDDLCRIEKIVYDDSEDLNQLKVSRIGMFAPHMFDESPENIYMAQIPPTPLYSHKSEVLNVKSIERSFTAGSGSEHIENDEKMVYKLHENEYGKVHEKFTVNCKNMLKSKYALALRSVDVKRTFDESGGRIGKVLEVSSLKEVLEEGESVWDLGWPTTRAIIYGLDKKFSKVDNKNVFIYDPGGYMQNVTYVLNLLMGMDRSRGARQNGVAIIIPSCSMAAVKEDIGAGAEKSTPCNERSFRSHCRIILDAPTVGGRLMLVDMAGTENIEHAGQIGLEAKMQTAKINQGNIALKRVVESIANGDSHVPFRDSKLTMLLQDSFEDEKSKILMVLYASPDPKEMHKTIATLEYGAKAKCIVRGPHTPIKDKGAEGSSTAVILGSRIEAMDQFINRLQMDNKIREKERNDVQKELMKKEEEISALRAKLMLVEQKGPLTNEEEVISMKVNEQTAIPKIELEGSNFANKTCLSTVYEDEEEEVDEDDGKENLVDDEAVDQDLSASNFANKTCLSTVYEDEEEEVDEDDGKENLVDEVRKEVIQEKTMCLNKLVYSLIAEFQWSFKGGTLTTKDLRDICSEILAPKQANGELYYILDQKLWQKYEKMQKSGGQLVFDTCSPDMLWNTTKAELMEVKVYHLPYIRCKSSEAVKKSFYLDAELDGPDWTQDYVKVHVLYVEVIEFLKSYEYRLSRQSSPEMDMDFLNRQELCKSINFDKVIAYGDVFQIAISSCIVNTSLSLDIGRSVVILFIQTYATLPTQKKQVLSNYCDDQPYVLLHVFNCERTGLKDHKLLGLFELSGSPFVAKKIAPSCYWCVTILVLDPVIFGCWKVFTNWIHP